MQQPPQYSEQPSYPYQPQQTGPDMPPPPQYQQPYTQYQPPYQPPMQPGMYSPPQQPKKRNRALFWIGGGCLALIVLGIIFAVIAVASAAHTVSTAVNNVAATVTADTGNNSTGNNNSTTSGTHYKVGQTANIASMDVTVNSIKTSQGDSIITPKTGNQYLIVDVTVNNKSGQAQNISSALSFTLKDSTGQKYTEAITTLSGITPPDGSVQDGAKLRGQIVYEVPKSMKNYTFDFQPDITSTNVVTWDISI